MKSNCPKCNGKFELGFIAGRQNPHTPFALTEWSKGEAKVSAWKGLEVGETLQVTAYRCTGCGYLEFFAY